MASRKTPVKKDLFGVVFDCTALNIREHPSIESNSVGVVKAGEELLIDEKESENEFYKITTSSGAQGYCMKKYIKIK